MSDLRFLDEYATDFRALDLLESMWIPAPARDGKDYRMGETPEQHDIASRDGERGCSPEVEGAAFN